MFRTRIKICGITRPEDAARAGELGVDAIGLVFHPTSPRAVTPEQACQVVAALPPFVTPVALFLDAEPARVEEILNRVPVGMLQFHGTESAAFCRRFGRPWIKALGIGDGADPDTIVDDYRDAAGLLIDGHARGAAGGSGQQADWERLRGERRYRLILAGGLGPGNVAEAVRAVRPDAVDVSTGVECAKGCKDATLMAQFIEEVRRGDRDAGSGND